MYIYIYIHIISVYYIYTYIHSHIAVHQALSPPSIRPGNPPFPLVVVAVVVGRWG